MSDFLTSVGIKIPDLAAGFGGGVVNALFFQRGKPMDVVSSVVGGAITANFMAQSVGRLCGTDVGVSGFIVGVTAMAICQGLLGAVKSKMQKLAERPPDA